MAAKRTVAPGMKRLDCFFWKRISAIFEKTR